MYFYRRFASGNKRYVWGELSRQASGRGMIKALVCFISVPHFCMIMLSLKSVGEYTHLTGAFIGMACINFCRVDLPFLFLPGGHPAAG